jgi:outer membrane protein assembly factor BamE (lipoprotein component of BamABCDE complex)
MPPSGRIVSGSLLAAAALALTAGCASIREHRGYFSDPALINSIQPGVDNRLSVERTLGRPTFVSQFGQPAWYYVATNTAQAPFTRPKTTDQAILKVNFDAAGNVSAVQLSGAEKVVNLSPDSDKTPTLGRERGFFEDLFGNIGAVGAGGAGAPGQGPGPNGS